MGRWISRPALIGWILGGLLAGPALMPICDLCFDCGCGWPGFGGHSHCDIHTPGPPDCPWCDHPSTFVLAMLLAYGLALVGTLRLGGRAPVLVHVLVSLTLVLAGTLFAGIVTSILTGRPVLAGF